MTTPTTITQDEYDALKVTLAARDKEIKRLKKRYFPVTEEIGLLAHIDVLKTEVKWLREALSHVSLCSQNSRSSKEECGRIARAALRIKEESQ